PLLDVAGGDDRLEALSERAVDEELDEGGAWVLASDSNRRRHVPGTKRIAHREQLRKTGQQPPSGFLRSALADDRDLVAPGGQTNSEGLLNGAQILVGDPEKCRQARFRQGDGLRWFRNLGCSSDPASGA